MSLAARRAAALLMIAGGLMGCSSGVQETKASQAALLKQADELAVRLDEHGVEGPGVVVQLTFGEEADLDLYVTDPLLDTAYFARHETRTGGRLAADVRCDTPGARVEEVRFDEPWAGRYRVGVDHPKRCDGASAPAPAAYAVTAFANGKTYRARGSVALEQFQLVVLEFEMQEGTADGSKAEID